MLSGLFAAACCAGAVLDLNNIVEAGKELKLSDDVVKKVMEFT